MKAGRTIKKRQQFLKKLRKMFNSYTRDYLKILRNQGNLYPRYIFNGPQLGKKKELLYLTISSNALPQRDAFPHYLSSILACAYKRSSI